LEEFQELLDDEKMLGLHSLKARTFEAKQKTENIKLKKERRAAATPIFDIKGERRSPQ